MNLKVILPFALIVSFLNGVPNLLSSNNVNFLSNLTIHDTFSPLATSKNEELTSQKNQTANWEVFTDPKLGISIKHPANIIVSRFNPGSQIVFVRAEDFARNPQDITITSLEILFRGEKGTTPEQALFNECPRKHDQPCDENFTPIKFNNAVGLETLGPNFAGDNFFLTKEDGQSQVIRILIFSQTQNENIEPFREMIKTFRFLD